MPYKNNDPFAPWNNPMYEDSPFAPHNNPMYKDDPFKPWNEPFGNENDLTDQERRAYGLRPKKNSSGYDEFGEEY
jgi:hypothetical protein